MFLEHRMRTFQGTFHANPDYSFWYGWSEMQRDLTEIKEKGNRDARKTQKKIIYVLPSPPPLPSPVEGEGGTGI